MFKKIFPVFVFLSSFLALCAAERFRFDSAGVMKIDVLSFRLVRWSPDWSSFQEQKNATVSADSGFPVDKNGVYELKGAFHVRNGTFSLLEKAVRSGSGGLEYSAELVNPKGIPAASVNLAAKLPVSLMANRPLLADGRNIAFGKKPDPKKISIYLPQVKNLILPLKSGTLKISGSFGLNLVDSRKWKSEFWSLRLIMKTNGSPVKKAELKVRFTYTPYQFYGADLRSAVNMGFRDEIAGDGKGGWTDQGPDNDLSMMPVGRRDFDGVEFDVIDPAKNNGKSCIVLRGKDRPAFPEKAEVVLKEPVAAKYLYLLNATAWTRNGKAGEITVEYDGAKFVDKAFARIPVTAHLDVANFWMPQTIRNGRIAWKGMNGSSAVGLYLSCFELTGAPVKKISFESAGQSVWMIVGATLSDRPPEVTQAEAVIMKAGPDWLPVKNKKDIVRGSILDFSGMLDAPAGKYGFLRNANGVFEFEKRPGKPVRFYGANLCFDTNFMEKKHVDRMVDEFAAAGYNLVRFHHFDGMLTEFRQNGKRPSTELSDWRLDRMDYMLSAFKKRGIYVTIDLYISRKLTKGEIPEFPEKAFSGELKALVLLYDSARKNFERFSANLLNHVNPYTGLAWKDDPAIAMISLLNENTVFATVKGNPFLRNLFEERFREHVKKNKLVLTDAGRERLWLRFLSGTYLSGYLKMEAFLKKLGVKAPLSDQNFWGIAPLSVLRGKYDYVDNHFYWGHPNFLETPWRLPFSVNNSCATGHYAGGVSGMFPTRIYGKPFSVSEWDYVNPNAYNAEGAFLIGAYASLQNWSSLCRFTYSHGSGRVYRENTPIGTFDIANDPLRMLSERAGVCFFLRGDVASSKVNFPVLVGTDFLEHPFRSEQYPSAAYRLGLIGGMGTLLVEPGKTPDLPPDTRAVMLLENTVKTKFPVASFAARSRDVLKRMLSAGAVAGKELDLQKEIFTSDTGEISLARRAANLKVSTPKSEGFLLQKDQRLSGCFASVENRLCFAGFLFASMDGNALSESSRILILHLTDTKNTGMKFRNRDMSILEEYGGLPLLIRRGEAEITVKRELSGFTLYAVDFSGKRLFPVPLDRRKGETLFTVSTLRNGKVVAAYELVK